MFRGAVPDTPKPNEEPTQVWYGWELPPPDAYVEPCCKVGQTCACNTKTTMTTTNEDIRLLAYKKWEEAGRPEGRDLEFWAAAEDELRTYSIDLNGSPLKVHGPTITYEQVVSLATGGDERPCLSVVYSKGCCPKTTGSLCRGQSVKLKDGMIFSAMDTSNA